MPGRLIPLVTQQVYHVFNKSIDDRQVFVAKRECLRTIETLRFYQLSSPPLRLSKLLNLPQERRTEIIPQLKNWDKLIEILAFCLMPNHFHFLLKQLKDNGISKFLSNFQNSFTRYFNTKNKRTGPIFLDQFKAVRVENEEQLLHVSRYIHLNPYTSFVVKDIKGLENYPWSSFPYYIKGEENEICSLSLVLASFKNPQSYYQFVIDQKDYQRELHKIQHLLLENSFYP